jgi:hypothetical protein
MTLTISTALIGAIGAAAIQYREDTVNAAPIPRAKRVAVTDKPVRCPGTQQGISYYRRAYTTHRTQMGLSGAVPRVWYPCQVARRRAVEWRERATQARAAYAEWNSSIGVHVRRLNRGLAGTPLAGLGHVFEQAGRRYGISPYFMAAASGTESSFGAAGCGNNPKNIWGLANCTGIWHVPYFETWDEAIGFYAKFLADRWPSATSPYHYYGYAACDACWGRKTSLHMQRFGGGTSTRY